MYKQLLAKNLQLSNKQVLLVQKKKKWGGGLGEHSFEQLPSPRGSELSTVGPPGLGKTDHNSLPLWMLLDKPTGRRQDWPPFQSHTAQRLSEYLPRASPEEEHIRDPCWEQPTVLSVGLELGMWCHYWLKVWVGALLGLVL